MGDPRLETLNREIVSCNQCHRLRQWCTSRKGQNKAHADSPYWAKPVPGFGDELAKILIVGLAPGAHGANRTGRPFTGDFAGDVLYKGLYNAGLSTSTVSLSLHDNLRLRGVYITNAVRCAPPGDKPDAQEFATCSPFLARELALLPHVKVIIPLGQKAYDAIKKSYKTKGSSKWSKFSHGQVVGTVDAQISILCCYHTSRRNVNRGLMDNTKLATVLTQAKALAELP